MKPNLFESLIEIAYNCAIELRDAFDTEVVCVRGRLWVIEDRQGGDHVLRPGESCRLRCDGRVLITALEPSLMCAAGPSRP
ncbi:MAG: DUF2917 domain-containing protein [Burkholderiales bacterium]|nr:MAG: DUF2917 domain-containing protein [Burkholderiales bacterium]